MFSGRRLRELVRERLAAAAEEIITEFEQITNQYKKAIDRQNRLLNMRWCSHIKIHRIDFPQQPECKEEDVLGDQPLWNQDRNSVLDQVGPKPLQVKEEQEDLCINQEGEQLLVKLEADTFMVTLISEEKQQSVAEPKSEQLRSHNSAGTEIQDEAGSRHADSESTKEEGEELKPKKRRLKTRSRSNSDDNCLTSKTLCENETDVPQQNDFNQEEVLDEQQLLNQERNFTVVPLGADCSQIKEEQEDICIKKKGVQFGLKQETQTFDEDAPQRHDCKEEVVLTVHQLCNHERNSSLDQEEQAAAQVKEEEEELCTSQEEEHFGLKQETVTLMAISTDNSETEPISEQLLSHSSPDTESQDQGAVKNANPGSNFSKLYGYGGYRVNNVEGPSLTVCYASRVVTDFAFQVVMNGDNVLGCDLFYQLGFSIANSNGLCLANGDDWDTTYPDDEDEGTVIPCPQKKQHLEREQQLDSPQILAQRKPQGTAAGGPPWLLIDNNRTQVLPMATATYCQNQTSQERGRTNWTPLRSSS
ncbi:uncharacterized protein KZ484_010998 [Pholidichthys leucotaenia]